MLNIFYIFVIHTTIRNLFEIGGFSGMGCLSHFKHTTMKEKEIWKDVKGYKGLYQVSNLGRIRSVGRNTIDKIGIKRHKNGKILKQYTNQSGYLQVKLYKNKKWKTISSHRIVCIAFINEPKKETVNHKNGIKTDNRAENLEWATRSENINHAIRIGLKKNKHGIEHKQSKYIIQLTRSGNYIKTHYGIHEAGRDTGIQWQNISKVLRGVRGTAGGYKWKYINT